MGKKRVAQKGGESNGPQKKSGRKKTVKKRVPSGVFYVQSTYNNTKVLLADEKGNTLSWSSSGALGFRGAKKGTPFAAAKIGEVIGEKAAQFGMKEASVVVKGVGAGREASIRAFSSKGIDITSIIDKTPVPWNGPQPAKPRRV
jgi:small subunit ribosomal protein S11